MQQFSLPKGITFGVWGDLISFTFARGVVLCVLLKVLNQTIVAYATARSAVTSGPIGFVFGIQYLWPIRCGHEIRFAQVRAQKSLSGPIGEIPTRIGH